MSDVVKEVIERAMKDEAFRQLLFNNPDEALKGYDLSAADRELLGNLDEDSLSEFSGDLGDRTTKGMWPGTGR
ncbi:MAG: hypothetical protein KC425_21450 [Anaerolineales bacterium]|nr:hypothetical protein [Anaerolineales bacterium]